MAWYQYIEIVLSSDDISEDIYTIRAILSDHNLQMLLCTSQSTWIRSEQIQFLRDTPACAVLCNACDACVTAYGGACGTSTLPQVACATHIVKNLFYSVRVKCNVNAPDVHIVRKKLNKFLIVHVTNPNATLN